MNKLGNDSFSLFMRLCSHVQYRPQILYSSCEPRNWNCTSVMSWKPSFICGGLNLLAKPVNAILGKICLDSGFNVVFSARTALLCSQTWRGVLNHTQRIEMPNFLASSTQTVLVSGSALVLSAKGTHVSA